MIPTRTTGRIAGSASAVVLFAALAAAQVVNPADKAKSQGTEQQLPPGQQPMTYGGLEPPRPTSFEAPAIVDPEIPSSGLREEDRIGPYGQPRWTAWRRFPSTRVYVVPEGQVEFEFWERVKVPRHGSTQLQSMYEIEFGLPYRFQIDLYAVSNQEGGEGPDFNEQKFEVRYAFADWGEIWGNPTAYVEYDAKSDEADVMEYKLLLGDELTTGWHWGSNLVWEHQMGDDFENVYELTGGLSKTIVDEKFSVGGEIKAELSNTADDRSDWTETLEIGPSIQWLPVKGMHLDFAPLVGIGGESRMFDIYFVLGWEF